MPRGKRVFSDKELSLFLSWLTNSTYLATIKNILQLTLWTGCRTGEVCKMAWGNIDFDKSTIHLKETKTGAERFVQLSYQARQFLETLHSSSDIHLFPSRGGKTPFHQKSLS
ncbi:tyrosine-type recombinase/integrase [Yersinia aldovae]|uniref:tyrosine-type recombinase/integrase n=1 Tax=Yersinia aldovae TaxID=29483 RepID=UPI0021BD35BB|nr:tyrosine-type recombinase/integrase [Yersinia aldovae]